MLESQRATPDRTLALDEVGSQAESLPSMFSDRVAAVEEVRGQAANVVRTVSAELQQLLKEMKNLAAKLQADVKNALESLESRLLALEKRSQQHCSRQELAELAATKEAGVSKSEHESAREETNLRERTGEPCGKVEEVCGQAAHIVRTVSAESQQLKEEMIKLAANMQADVKNTLESLASRLLTVEKRSQHHCSREEMAELAATREAGISDRFEKMECRLLNLESKSQHECSREEANIQEKMGEQCGKVCDNLHRAPEAAMQEAHAALRVELEEHSTKNGETLLTMQRAFEALRHEFANHKARRLSQQSTVREETKLHVKIHSLSGEVCIIDTNSYATLGDVKENVSNQLGHSSWSQRLSLGETLLVDSSKSLEDLGIADASTLSLVVIPEPIGQCSLTAPHGEKLGILWSDEEVSKHCVYPVEEILNEFEFMSFQAASSFYDGEHFWPQSRFEALRCHLYWTTRSDGCRYEYWSTAGDYGDRDGECGVLVRIDSETMTVTGTGSADGLQILDEFGTSDVIQELVREGWPRPWAW
mmetsp:Transcript_9498/g.17426  ORF Transcript_9498/g.17426 Transcript_9498/m.17426 type:complete len:536 (+) Transcript_9498:57-1664(+)